MAENYSNKKIFYNINEEINSMYLQETADNDIPISAGQALSKLQIRSRRGMGIGYLNFNSIRYKFKSMKLLVAENIAILTISETKLDNTFAKEQFLVNGFKTPIRYDRNGKGGSHLIYIREGIPVRLLTDYELPNDIEAEAIDITFTKKKWLIINACRPPRQCENYFFDKIWQLLHYYSSKHENFALLGDFNTRVTCGRISSFLEDYNLKKIISSSTCFKSDNPKCIRPLSYKSQHKSSKTLQQSRQDYRIPIQ